QNDREVALEDLLQRPLARFCGEQPLPKLIQDRLVDEELVGAIVDDQDVGPIVLCNSVGIRVHFTNLKKVLAQPRLPSSQPATKVQPVTSFIQATRAVRRPSTQRRPAWRGSPTPPPPCTSRDRPSSPSR